MRRTNRKKSHKHDLESKIKKIDNKLKIYTYWSLIN